MNGCRIAEIFSDSYQVIVLALPIKLHTRVGSNYVQAQFKGVVIMAPWKAFDLNIVFQSLIGNLLRH